MLCFPTRSDLLTFFITAAAILPAPSRAHGPAPAGVDVLLTDEAGAPVAVKLSRAAAVKVDGAWRFVCSSMWEGPETPLMLSPDNESVLVTSISGVFRMDANGAFTKLPTEDVSSARARTLVSLNNTAYALTGFSGGSTIWRVDDETTAVKVFEDTIKSMASDGTHLLVAWLKDDVLEVRTMTGDAETVGEPLTFPWDIDGTVVLQPTPTALYARVLESSRFRLFRLNPPADGAAAGTPGTVTELADSDTPLHGPVEHDGTVFVSLERKLSTIDGDTITPMDSTLDLTCLVNRSSATFACDLPDVYSVSTAGTSTVFELSALQPPLTDGLDATLAANCELDWLDFATDAGLVETPAPDTTETAEPVTMAETADMTQSAESDDSGCSSTGRSGSGWVVWLTLLGFYWNSRRRMSRIRSRLA